MPNPYRSRRARRLRTDPVTVEQAPPSHLDSTFYPSATGRTSTGSAADPVIDDVLIPLAETTEDAADMTDPDVEADAEPGTDGERENDGEHVPPISDGDEMPVNAVDLAAWITTPERAEQARAAETQREKPRSTVLGRIDKVLGDGG